MLEDASQNNKSKEVPPNGGPKILVRIQNDKRVIIQKNYGEVLKYQSKGNLRIQRTLKRREPWCGAAIRF